MNRIGFYKLILILIITVIPEVYLNAQNPLKIDLGGPWQMRRDGTIKWGNAKVPGLVHLDLLKANVISDPFYNDTEPNLQWIGETAWEYRRVFLVPDSLFAFRHLELVFEGIDTYANVYLNDSLILSADNMFRTWNVDVKNILRYGANELKVKFPSVVQENKDRYSKLKYKLPGDEKVVCRKAAYHFGWDWGPTFITSGIWKPVYLKAYNYVNLLAVQYSQKEITETNAHISAVFTVYGELSDTATITVSSNNEVLFSQRNVIRKGPNFLRCDFDIRNPMLWWTNGLGEPYLYSLNHEIRFAGKTVAKGTTRIGIRKIELIRKSDSLGSPFYFKLNGIPVFMKGANYIPQDNFLTRVKDSSYAAIIKSVADANMNMLRVWGGGIYENDIFYDLCDEKGILVWQDFMFANAMYPGDKEFKQNVQAEVGQNLVRLRNHPCIALWCGNNEIEEGWKNWGWQKQYNISKEDSVEIWNNYLSLYWNLLPGLVNRYDSGVPYISTSPMIGWGHPESLKNGDSHYWGVWWGKEPFDTYKTKVGRFMSEYGFQGFPPFESLRKSIYTPYLDLKSPILKSHEKHPQGLELIDEYLLRDYKTPKDFQSYVYVSQVLQAEGIKTAMEAHRRAKPYCMGSLYWQLNDCWPAISWSSRDYYGKRKALHYFATKAFAPFLISPQYEQGRVKVTVVSDKLEDKKAELRLKLIDFNGKQIWQKSVNIDIPANSSTVFFDSTLLAFAPKLKLQSSLLFTLLVSGNDTLSQNILYFDAVKNLQLDSAVIKRTIKEIAGGYEVELTTDKLAKNIYLITPLIRGEFSDNFFDLLPGETRKVIYYTDIKNPNFSIFLRIKTIYDSCKVKE